MLTEGLAEHAAMVLGRCRAAGLRIATAESCTGGLLAAALTAVPGSSDVVECGFVVYSNAAKAGLLGLDPAVIETAGAVSEAVAIRLAKAALQRSAADLAISITGVAGPDGAMPDAPVGTVWFGLARKGMPARAELRTLAGDRDHVRQAAVEEALAFLGELAGQRVIAEAEGN